MHGATSAPELATPPSRPAACLAAATPQAGGGARAFSDRGAPAPVLSVTCQVRRSEVLLPRWRRHAFQCRQPVAMLRPPPPSAALSASFNLLPCLPAFPTPAGRRLMVRLGRVDASGSRGEQGSSGQSMHAMPVLPQAGALPTARLCAAACRAAHDAHAARLLHPLPHQPPRAAHDQHAPAGRGLVGRGGMEGKLPGSCIVSCVCLKAMLSIHRPRWPAGALCAPITRVLAQALTSGCVVPPSCLQVRGHHAEAELDGVAAAWRRAFLPRRQRAAVARGGTPLVLELSRLPAAICLLQ